MHPDLFIKLNLHFTHRTWHFSHLLAHHLFNNNATYLFTLLILPKYQNFWNITHFIRQPINTSTTSYHHFHFRFS